MLPGDFLAVLPGRFCDLIDEVIGLSGRRDDVHRADVETLKVFLQGRVLVLRDRERREERVLLNKRLADVWIKRNEVNVERAGSLSDRARWHGTAKESGIGCTIAQQINRTALRGIDRIDVVPLDTVLFQNRADKHLETGTRGANADLLALQIGNRLDPRVGLGDEHRHVGSHRDDSSNVVLFLPALLAANGKEADRRIRHRQLQITIRQLTNVVLRSLRSLRLDLLVDRVRRLVSVERLADRNADRMEGSTDRSRAKAQKWCRDRLLFAILVVTISTARESSNKSNSRQCADRDQREIVFLHRISPERGFAYRSAVRRVGCQAGWWVLTGTTGGQRWYHSPQTRSSQTALEDQSKSLRSELTRKLSESAPGWRNPSDPSRRLQLPGRGRKSRLAGSGLGFWHPNSEPPAGTCCSRKRPFGTG